MMRLIIAVVVGLVIAVGAVASWRTCSSFSVWRHSAGSFRDIASIWLRTRTDLAARSRADHENRTRYSYVSVSPVVSVRE